MRTPPKLMPALITPFGRNGSLDIASHETNLTTLYAKGLQGFLIAGSTGEGPYLEPGEREALTRAARRSLGEDVYVLCGVHAQSVRQGKKLVAEAGTGGADAVLVTTPTSLARGNHEAIESYYLDLVEDSPIPMFLSSVPAVTGYEIPTDSVRRLATHPNTVGLKDSGGRPVRIQELRRAIDEPFVTYAGASGALAPSMAAGSYGAITASANYAFQLVAEIIDAPTQGDADAAQQKLTSIVRKVESHGIPGTKCAAAAAGLRAGYPRSPLRPVAAAVRAAIVGMVQEMELASI